MNVHDAMSETEVLRAASQSLSGVPVASPPDVEAIMARGRARRRRRLSAAGGLSVAAGAALVLGLTGVLGPAPARSPGTIRTAAFTLVSNSNGTATLTINPPKLLHPAVLRNDLARYGIPAMVTSGSFCYSDPAPAGFAQVVTGSTLHQVGGPTLTFNPAAMPAGTELSFGNFQAPKGQVTALALIDTNSYTCTSAPPPNVVGPNSPAETVLSSSPPGPAGS